MCRSILTYPAERLATMLDDAGSRVLLTQQRLRRGLPEQRYVAMMDLNSACIGRNFFHQS